MNLRAKLLILLATVALLPLLVLTVVQYASLQDLARDLEAATADRLAGDLTTILRQTVEANAYGVEHQAETVGLALEVATLGLERRLADPHPAREPVYWTERFAQRASWPPGTRLVALGGSRRRSAVTFDAASILLARGRPDGPIAAQAARLAAMSPVYRDLYAHHSGVFQFFAALDDGLFVVYPGHAQPRRYDPRVRPWYAAGRNAPQGTWGPPFYSAATNRLTIPAVRAIRGPDGRLVGVSAAEIAILALMRSLDARWRDPDARARDATASASLDRLAAQADSLLVRPQGGRVRVLARREYESRDADWNAAVNLDAIAPDDPAVARAIVADIRAGRSGARRVAYRGHETLWAYSPVPTFRGAILLTLPFDRVTAEAAALVAELRARAVAQVRLSILVALLLVGAVALLALAVSSLATRPVLRLVETAARIGAGDLAARADVRGSDEIGRLGAAFNAMIPQLEAGLRMERSLELARTVQQSLLPREGLALAGLEVAGISAYCDETGGDYYDFFDLSAGGTPRVAVAVGDVSGHGIAAALLMSEARAFLRSALELAPDPGPALGRTNRLLCADVHDGSFMTLALVLIDPDGTVRWVNAAHDASLVYHAASGEFASLEGGDLPLGVDAGWRFTEHRLRLRPGPVVLAIGTDGVWETRNAAGEAYGRDRLCAAIRAYAALPARELCRRAIGDVVRFRGSAAQDDDVTLVIAKLDVPAGPAAAPEV